jgi:hypothetical protein
MEDIAIAYVTCDGYSHVWDDWYAGFLTHWDSQVKMYFCGERLSPAWPGWVDIPHDPVPVDQWTTKLRAQVEQIEEENIFVWLDDLIQTKHIEFDHIYAYFLKYNLDSFRIMMRDSAAYTYDVGMLRWLPVKQLIHDSPYLISYSPNIYKKQFLLDCLQWEETPWENEIMGSIRIRPWLKNICMYQINGWCVNSIIKGYDQRDCAL